MEKKFSPHTFDNQYISNREIDKNDYILHYKDNSLLLKTNGKRFELPRKKDFADITEHTKKTFLFSLNKVSCFLIWDTIKAVKPDFTYRDIYQFRTLKQPEILWISLTGYDLRNWYKQNQYCGKCGAKTQHKDDERAIVCTKCDNTIYPKISPAIIVAIVCNDKILLARNSKFKGGWYALIAGFVDVGESLEETVRREVKEEVGLDVKNIRYYGNQPWPLSGSMMIGFVAEADDTQEIIVDGKEISEAAWFTRGDLPNHPPAISISGEMIEKFERDEL